MNSSSAWRKFAISPSWSLTRGDTQKEGRRHSDDSFQSTVVAAVRYTKELRSIDLIQKAFNRKKLGRTAAKVAKEVAEEGR